MTPSIFSWRAVHFSAAICSATIAGRSADAAPKPVVDRQFFTGFDAPEAAKKNVSLGPPHIQIRGTAMVDVFGAVALVRIDDPGSVQLREDDSVWSSPFDISAPRLGVRDLVPDVFNYYRAGGDGAAGKNPQIVNR